MPNHAVSLALLFFFAAGLRADDSLVHARRAQARLGSEVWARVVRVQNESRFNKYPRSFYALVFELGGILWFYTDTDGTQSFSLHRGALEQEKADFGPGLRDIHPAFTGWTIVPDDGLPVAPGSLPNGCLVECVALLRTRAARDEAVGRSMLLTYYVRRRSGLYGHTVLALPKPGGLEVIDPLDPERPVVLPGANATNALLLARRIRGDDVTQARILPVELPRPAFSHSGGNGQFRDKDAE